MQIFLVGGAVRDQLLNYPVYDKDWVVVGASADEMIDQGFQPVGQDFPVFINPQTGEEYALARTERKSGKGYTGFKYHASKEVTLEEDLLRRDLTINAMAQDDNGNIVDPYNGRDDLNKKLLRHVSPAFSEDPLRVLRVARFSARYHHLGFKVAEETLELMQKISASDELEHLTAERVWKELERALAEPSPELFFELLIQTSALDKVIPELSSHLSRQMVSEFALACKKIHKPEGRFACLLTLCKTTEVESICARLKAPNAFRDLALQCSSQYENLKSFDQVPATKKLATIQSLDLIRRPQRISPIIECITALSSESKLSSIHPILEEIDKVDPQQLIKEGFKGAELGKEIQLRRIKICQNHTIEEE